jgi:hypothetical protein
MNRSTFVKALVAVALSATAAQAQTSKLNIVGTVNLYQLVAGSGGNLVIDFVPPLGGGVGAVYTPPGTTGNTGVFAPLPTSFVGTNIDFVFGTGGGANPTPTCPGADSANCGGGVAFLTLGGYTFYATSFGPGNTGTPVTVAQVGNTVFALLSVDGYVTGPGLGGNAPFTGGYSAQIPGTIAGVINAIETNTGARGGIGDVSVSATFTVSSVPEPATMTLMATGFLALAGVGYARRRQGA